MNIQISADNEKLIEGALSTGAYQSADQIFSEALELFRRREELRNAVNAGIDQLDQGQGIPAEEVFARLEQRLMDR